MMKPKLWNNYLDNWIKVNWIKIDRVALFSNTRKYLRDSSLRLLIPCALIDFIRHYLKRDRRKYTEWDITEYGYLDII